MDPKAGSAATPAASPAPTSAAGPDLSPWLRPEMSSEMRMDCGVAARALPGESVSGDAYVLQPTSRGTFIAVLDALGHGAEAAEAAAVARRCLEEEAHSSLLGLMARCHQRLQGTRGVVMSLAFFDSLEPSLTWLGVGNVAGVLLRRDAHVIPGQEVLLLRGGVLGDHLPRLQAAILPIGAGDTLVMATDGIRGGFADHLPLEGRPREIADHILRHHYRGGDDALVLVARFIRGEDRP